MSFVCNESAYYCNIWGMLENNRFCCNVPSTKLLSVASRNTLPDRKFRSSPWAFPITLFCHNGRRNHCLFQYLYYWWHKSKVQSTSGFVDFRKWNKIVVCLGPARSLQHSWQLLFVDKRRRAFSEIVLWSVCTLILSCLHLPAFRSSWFSSTLL